MLIWLPSWIRVEGIHLHSHTSHNLSQCEKNSSHILPEKSNDTGNLLTIYWQFIFWKLFSKKEFFRKENSFMEKISLKTAFLTRFQEFKISEISMKNWIEWLLEYKKFEKKHGMQTYCKIFLLPFTCESQSSRLEKPDWQRIVFTLWQEFRSQWQGQIQMNTLNIAITYKAWTRKVAGNSLESLAWTKWKC